MVAFDVVEERGAEVLGRYTSDFYAGTPAITRHRSGEGHAWYAATHLDAAGVEWVVAGALADAGVGSAHGWKRGLEALERHRDDTTYLFLLNHGESEVSVEVDRDGRSLLDGRDVTHGETLVLAPTDVVIVRS